MNKHNIAVIGATGAVGREALSILSNLGIPKENIIAIASENSVSQLVPYGDKENLIVKNIHDVNFKSCDFAIFSAGSSVSEKYANYVASQGCIVIDNTSYFRMHENIPLIVPEINFDDLKKYRSNIIANPNCSTIQMVMALKPLHDVFKLKELVVSTYQSTSGAGYKGVNELIKQHEQLIRQKPICPQCFKKQIAFNVIPQIDEFIDTGYTKEEMKMINETKKILNLEDIHITATCVRVPVVRGHAVSVFAKFEKEIEKNKAIEIMNNFEGVTVSNDQYITPIDVAYNDDVFVSRIRKHPSIENALSFWCVSDNLRKGAALNAIQIASKIIKNNYQC